MALGDDRNGGGGPEDPRLSDDPLARGSRGLAPTGLLGSRAREAMRGPSRPGPGRSPNPQRGRWRSLGLLAVLALAIGVALHRHQSTCITQSPPQLTRSDARFWVALGVAGVPCQSTDRVVSGLRDSAGAPMVGLDPISTPSGDYLGVYDPSDSQMALARSNDLTSWRRVRVLGAGNAPTLQPIPGTSGYLLAYMQARGSGERIRVSYFRSLSALLAAHEATSIDLPLRLSATANADPWFMSVSWNGGLRRSQMTIAFDYASAGSAAGPGPDREAIGVLRGFRGWSATPDTQLDQQLDRRGLTGNHGQGRQFVIAGRPWRLYAAQDEAGSHIVMDDVKAGEVFALKLETADGTFATSFGRPVAHVLPAPTGSGQALVVSLYVYGSGNTRSEAGELLYWTPIS
jgi:hypothetical protein